MVVVFNRGAAAVLALSAVGWAATQIAELEPWRLVVGFGVMSLAGGGLELQSRVEWRPRLFWIIPAWLVGFAGLGLALRSAGQVALGSTTLGLLAVTLLVLLIRAIATKPGGGWLASLACAGAVGSGLQLMSYARPEWKHPVFYALNAIALGAMAYCAWRLHQERRAAREKDAGGVTAEALDQRA